MSGHIRGENYSPTTCIVWNPDVLSKIESCKKNKSRSQVVNELVQLGFKYKELVKKKKQRKAGNVI